MNPQETRPYVGAAGLWRQIQAGGPDASAPWCGYPYFNDGCGPGPGGIQRSLNMPLEARDDTVIRFPDSATGFKVTSLQQMGRRLGLGVGVFVSHERHFVARHALTLGQKRSVALAIFMEVSMGFERMQGRFPFSITGAGDSSFSSEDLVSNLVGFYIAIGAVTKFQALKAAHPVSKATALAVWDRDGPLGSNKNKTFTPLLSRNTGHIGRDSCWDECLSQPLRAPAFMSSIIPARKGLLFMDFPRP